MVDDAFGEVGELLRRQAELRIDFRILLAEARDLATCHRRVRPAAQRIAVGQRREGGLERDDFETVLWQLEFSYNMRAQQTDDVGEDGKPETRIQLLADRRAAEDMTTLEHQHGLAGLCQVGGGGETVVAAPDDDRIPDFRHRISCAFSRDRRTGVR